MCFAAYESRSHVAASHILGQGGADVCRDGRRRRRCWERTVFHGVSLAYDRAVIVSPDHWLTKARRAPSPNHNARPDPEDISLVVVHGISLPPGKFGTGAVERFFCNTLDCSRDPCLADLEGVRVSAHLFVGRGGGITQFVPFDCRAWHAGVSRWRGRTDCNDFSIGIELEGTDVSGYTNYQYVALARILDALVARYPRLDRSALVGHNEIAPGRKTDPGPRFDWRLVHRGIFR